MRGETEYWQSCPLLKNHSDEIPDGARKSVSKIIALPYAKFRAIPTPWRWQKYLNFFGPNTAVSKAKQVLMRLHERYARNPYGQQP
jgi:hypothetical protein